MESEFINKIMGIAACISDMVLQELQNCYKDKRQYLLEKIADIDFEFYGISDDVKELAQKLKAI